jgi:hypothetical protein
VTRGGVRERIPNTYTAPSVSLSWQNPNLYWHEREAVNLSVTFCVQFEEKNIFTGKKSKFNLKLCSNHICIIGIVSNITVMFILYFENAAFFRANLSDEFRNSNSCKR